MGLVLGQLQNDSGSRHPIMRMSNPSLLRFVEEAALPHLPVIIQDVVPTWGAASWHAETIAQKCPDATANVVAPQGRPSLEFANLALKARTNISDFLGRFFNRPASDENRKGGDGRTESL